jgi:hypothetical protein
MAALAALRLPIVLDIDGLPETGTELRLTCPEAGILESLCIAWFRFSDAATPSFDTDISVSPLTRVIPGASSALYTCGPDDVGRRLGVTVRAAGSSSTRWIIMPTAVRQLASSVEVRVRVMPHEHSKYCDRRVRVCTAAGRYREGATLRADVTGLAPELFSQYGIVWYRSTTSDPRLSQRRSPRLSLQISAEPSMASASARGAGTTGLMRAAPMSPLDSPFPVTPRDTDSPRPAGIMSQAWNLLSGSSRRNMVRSQSMGSEAAPAIASSSSSSVLVLHHGSISHSSGSSDALAGLTYVRVRQRSSDELPPAPPDHLSSTPLPELKARLAALASRMAQQSGAVLSAPLPLPPSDTPLGELEYALFADDVDRLICCALVRLDAPGDIPTYIQPHGPIRKPRSATAPGLTDTDASFQETQRAWFAYPEAAGAAKAAPSSARMANDVSARAGAAARSPPMSPHKSFRDMQKEWFAHPSDNARVQGAVSSGMTTPVAAVAVAPSTLSLGEPVRTPATGTSAVSSATLPAAQVPFVDERWGDTPEKLSTSDAIPAADSCAGEATSSPVPVIDLTRLASISAPESKPSPASLPTIAKPICAEPTVGALRSDMRLSVSIGPIEAAPPRAREVWIDGVPAVGCLLTGHVYYYGGYEVSFSFLFVRHACGQLSNVSLLGPGFFRGLLGSHHRRRGYCRVKAADAL